MTSQKLFVYSFLTLISFLTPTPVLGLHWSLEITTTSGWWQTIRRMSVFVFFKNGSHSRHTVDSSNRGVTVFNFSTPDYGQLAYFTLEHPRSLWYEWKGTAVLRGRRASEVMRCAQVQWLPTDDDYSMRCNVPVLADGTALINGTTVAPFSTTQWFIRISVIIYPTTTATLNDTDSDTTTTPDYDTTSQTIETTHVTATTITSTATAMYCAVPPVDADGGNCNEDNVLFIATCESEPENDLEPPIFGDEYLCVQPETLSQIARQPVDSNDVNEQIIKTAEIIKIIVILQPADVSDLVTQLGKTVDYAANLSTEGAEKFVEVYGAVISAPTESLVDVGIGGKTATELLEFMDRFTQEVPLGNLSRINFTANNVIVHVIDVKKENIEDIPIGVHTFRKEHRESTNTGGRKHSTERVNGTLVHEKPDNTTHVLAGIYLPKNAVYDLINTTNNDSLRLSFVVYNRSAIFDPSTAKTGRNKSINSQIISAQLTGINDYLNDEKVVIVLEAIDQTTYNLSTSTCTYWDTGLKQWSGDGCTGTLHNDEVTCECTHLTNFAILMSKKFSRIDDIVLSVLTKIGLSVSMAGLLMTILTFILSKQVRKSEPHRVLFCLALTLLVTYIVFLAGVVYRDNDIGCMVSSALLHYLLLAAFFWMLTEGILQYLRIVKVFGTYVEKFILKASLFCWVTPLVPIAIVLGVNRQAYMGKKDVGYCWLETSMSYWAFLIPIGVILLVNTGVFIAVFIKITQRGAGAPVTKSARTTALFNVRAGIGCMLLLGLTWIFGYLSLFDPSPVFAYLFTIINSLQGFFIFLFFTLRDKTVRSMWVQLLCKDRSGKGTSTGRTPQGRAMLTQASPLFPRRDGAGAGTEKGDSVGQTGRKMSETTETRLLLPSSAVTNVPRV